MVWRYLFDTELSQRGDIESLREAASFHDEHLTHQGRELAALRRSNERLGLALEAVTRILELKLGVTREEVALMIQRIDLADGVEDGKIGHDVTARAPACPRCGKPVNPTREHCLYCDAPLGAKTAAGSPYRTGEAPPRRSAARPTVACSSCGAVVPLDESDMSTDGPVCARCSRNVNG